MTTVGYARVSSTGQDLGVQLEKLEATGCEKVFKEKRSGADAGRPELKRCLEYLRDGDYGVEYSAYDWSLNDQTD